MQNIRVVVYMPKKEHERLKRQAKAAGLSLSIYVRQLARPA